MNSKSELALDYFERLMEQLVASGKLRAPSPGRTVEEDNPDFAWLKWEALRRLDVGAVEYGPDNFRREEVRLPNEALEECADILCYCLLEIAKTAPEETHKVLLAQAAFHAVCSAQYLMMYRSKQRLYD